MSNKHAYLIMVHKNVDQVKLLLSLLDDYDNDFYVHCDIKAKDISLEELKSTVAKSNITFVNRMNNAWGGYSLVQCEVNLLKEATKNQYLYYHLISGQDMPLKPQREIKKFFLDNEGINFVHFGSDEETARIIESRIKTYRLFEGNGRCSEILNRVFNKLQRILGINRIKKGVSYGFGAQWFSITDALARYVVEKEAWIKGNFSHSICADEIFLQTLVKNSPFKEKLYLDYSYGYKQVMRYIDWQRGNGFNPYTFRKDDFEALIESGYLFARKFDEKVDSEIIHMIWKYIKDNE